MNCYALGIEGTNLETDDLEEAKAGAIEEASRVLGLLVETFARIGVRP